MRAVIAEDLVLLRDGLTRLLEAYDIEVVAAVDDAIKLGEALRTHQPDIAVVDVRMPPTFTDGPVRRLTPREREVLALMAQGRSNAAIASALLVTEKPISKHTSDIFMKLDPDPDDDSSNRRVMAVVAYLQS